MLVTSTTGIKTVTTAAKNWACRRCVGFCSISEGAVTRCQYLLTEFDKRRYAGDLTKAISSPARPRKVRCGRTRRSAAYFADIIATLDCYLRHFNHNMGLPHKTFRFQSCYIRGYSQTLTQFSIAHKPYSGYCIWRV